MSDLLPVATSDGEEYNMYRMTDQQFHAANHINTLSGLEKVFINKRMTINDLYLVLKIMLLLALFRLVLSGLNNPRTKKLPTVFKLLLSRWILKKKEHKFYENLWYACWHSISFFWTLGIIYKECLSFDDPGWPFYFFVRRQPGWFFLATPAEQRLHESYGWPLLNVLPHMQIFYLTELAFWTSNILFLFLETKRSDFHVMLVHHITTCFLLGGSYAMNFWRIGLIVLLPHDIVDIFLYWAKVMHCSTGPRWIVDGLFISFAVAFFLARLVFFPICCLWPCVSWGTIREISKGFLQYPWDIAGAGFLQMSLVILQVLHIFWFWLIIKMVVTLKTKKTVTEGGDIRSDDDDSDSEARQPQKPSQSESSGDLRQRKR
eukprot:Selendium_serpulae@DN4808_c0_g1_i2.p1